MKKKTKTREEKYPQKQMDVKNDITIKAYDIKKNYDSFTLGSINLELKKGTLFGCLGPNGAGKSTLVKILSGQIRPSNGEIIIQGIDMTKEPIIGKTKIGIIPEQESPPSFLSVSEYLQFICKVRKIESDEIQKWLHFFDFNDDKDTLIKDLSRGTKQKVVATQAFIHEPTIVFIDEPLINLDPLMQKKFKSYLVEYAKKGNTIFLSTHVLSIAEEICTHIGILKKGTMIMQGNIRDIKRKKKKLEDYFIGVVDEK